MTKVKPIEQIYKQFFQNNPQAARKYFELRKTNPKEAQKYLNSIFTGTINTTKNFINSGKNWLGSALLSTATAGAVMNATANPSGAAVLEVGKAALGDVTKGADAIAEYIIPFYSGTKEQIQAVNDYLDGKIDKDTYYKRVADGTLSQGLDALLYYLGGKAASKAVKSKVKGLINKGIKTAETKGKQAATKAVKNEVAVIRNQAVRQNPTAAKAIKEGTQAVNKEVDQAINAVLSPKNTPDKTRPGDTFGYFFENYVGKSGAKAAQSGANKATKALSDKGINAAEKLANGQKLSQSEEESFIKMVRENADELGKLAKEAGVTNKKDIPKFIKFIKDLGKILENSPLNIRNNAKAKAGLDVAGKAYNVGMSGLTLFDLWNEYNNYGGTDFLPTLAANAGRLGGTFLSKNLAFKILLSQLGYGGGDKLSRYALRKLGFENTLTTKEKEEMTQGYRQPGMSKQLESLGEYFTGSSGRRYHVVNDKVYAFDTGSMVNVSQFLNDINALQAEKIQQTQDKLANVRNQKQDIMQAMQAGYDVPQETITSINNEEQRLITDLEKLTNDSKVLNITDNYSDENGDIIDQVYKNEIETNQQLQQANKIQNQQQAAQNLDRIYSLLENQYKTNIENYFTPENLAMDYYQYMEQAVQGHAEYLTPEQFANIQKAKALYQVVPQIRNQAINEYNTMYQLAQRDTELGIKDTHEQEVARNNYVKNLIDQYEANEKERHNRQQELLGLGNLNVNQGKLDVAQKELGIKQQQADIAANRAKSYEQYVNQQGQLVGPKQFAMMGSGLADGVMSGLTADQMLNVNPELGKQLFPGAFQQPQGQPQQTTNTKNQSQFSQNKNMIQGLLGNQ